MEVLVILEVLEAEEPLVTVQHLLEELEQVGKVTRVVLENKGPVLGVQAVEVALVLLE